MLFVALRKSRPEDLGAFCHCHIHFFAERRRLLDINRNDGFGSVVVRLGSNVHTHIAGPDDDNLLAAEVWNLSGVYVPEEVVGGDGMLGTRERYYPRLMGAACHDDNFVVLINLFKFLQVYL